MLEITTNFDAVKILAYGRADKLNKTNVGSLNKKSCATTPNYSHECTR
jgi:hypothetical protein